MLKNVYLFVYVFRVSPTVCEMQNLQYGETYAVNYKI